MPKKYQSLYKFGLQETSSIRSSLRSVVCESRKERRAEILSQKRFRSFGSSPAGLSDVSLEEVRTIIADFKKAKSSPDKLNALKLLNQAFVSDDELMTEFFKVDSCLQKLTSIFTGNDAELQVEAAFCLTNLTAGEHGRCFSIAKMVGPYLITYLNSNSILLQDQCAWALGNLAADGNECRTMLVMQGILHPLPHLLDSHADSVVYSTAFCLMNLMQDDLILEQLNVPRVVNSLCIGLRRKPSLTADVQIQILWDLAYILSIEACDFSETLETVISSLCHVMEKVLLEKSEKDVSIKESLLCFRCIGGLFGSPLVVSQDVASELVNHFLPLLDYIVTTAHSNCAMKEALWALSNMLGNPAIAQQISGQEAIMWRMIKVSPEITKEVIVCLCNLHFHCPNMAVSTLSHVISILDLLLSPDDELVLLMLAFLELILRLSQLKTFEGRNSFLKNLCALSKNHMNEHIQRQAQDILCTYFSDCSLECAS